MKTQDFWVRHSSVITIYVIALFLLVLVSILRPGYASANNLNILSAAAAVLGITAIGQTFVILTGGMDLSIPWMFSISAFLFAGITGGDSSTMIYAIPAALLAGIGMGLVNGFGIAYVGIVPVIMTISTNIIFQGLLVGISGGMPGGAPPETFKIFASGGMGSVSTLFMLWVIISAIVLVVLHKTRFGRNIYSVGSNENVAFFSGINVKLTKLSAYAICGLFTAAAAILYSGRLGQLYLAMGEPYQMQSIAAVAIGGVSLNGGKGSYAGTMGGVLIIVVLNGFLSAMNIPPNVQKIVYGAVLFISVLIAARQMSLPTKKRRDLNPA
ncbi:MAG: ABC transporter permease [Treponema sp.]|jgi:ribose transport system permease protein|nr:ABC transporter permease [Treponema sp.]